MFACIFVFDAYCNFESKSIETCIRNQLKFDNIPQDGSKYPRFVSCSVMIQCINHEFDDIILNFKIF